MYYRVVLYNCEMLQFARIWRILGRRTTLTNTVQDGNIEFAKADLKEQIRLVETSFKTVLDSNLHEDDKAGRILSAMSFLTAAAALIFSVVHPSNSSTTSGAGSSSIPIYALSGYIFFVLVGVALYLGALGPNFNRPSWFPHRRREVKSLLFFKNIGALDEETWTNYWLNDKNTLAQVQDLFVKNYIYECWLIAQKEEAKVTLMSLGSLSFRIAILFFVFLMATLFLPDPGVFWVYLLIGFFGILACFLLMNLTQPPQKFQLLLQKLRWQGDNQQTAQPTQQGDTKKVPWQTYFLAALTGLFFLGSLVLLFLRLTGLIA